MKSSKKLAMFVTALTMCSSIAVISACQTTEEHTHSYTWTESKAATCTEEGKETGVCTCGETDERAIPALGHDYEWTVTTEPTCEGKGKETGVCKRDGCASTDERDVDPTGHDYEWTVTTDPTCDEEGEETGVCKNDESHTTTRPVDAAGHTYGEWALTKAPTCEGKGEETRVCSKNEEHTDTRDVDPIGHKYGEWKVTLLPKQNATGTAQKVCANNQTHVLSIELPALSEESKYTKAAGTEANTFNYTYKHEGENISFTVYEGALAVSKAVQFAEANMSKVTDGSVRFDSQLAGNNSQSGLEFEYGDNYMYLRDSGNLTTYGGEVKMYIDRMFDEYGNISYFFPMTTGQTGSTVLNGEKSTAFDIGEFFERGIPYTLLYAEHPLTNGITFYGAADLIKTLYSIGTADANGDFTESVTENSNGTYTYNFSFGYRGDKYGYQSEGYFRIYNVEFVLDEDYVLKTATITNTGYNNNVMNPDTGAVTNNNNFVTDEDGHTTLTENAFSLYSQTIRITHNSLGADDERHPNPYKYEDFVIQSFDVIMGSETLQSDQTVNMTATNSVKIRLSNVTPTTFNANFDSINMYQLDEDGNLQECDFMYPIDDYHLKVYYDDSTRTITINPYVSGEQTLIIKTENITFTLNLNIATIAPGTNSFQSSVYSYNDVTEEVTWQALNTHTIYAGQPLKFKTAVVHPAYEETGYTVKVTDEAGNEVDGCITDGAADGVDVSIFQTETVGKYTVTLTSIKSTSRTITLEITVTEAPSVAEILKGEYGNEDNETKVTFTPSAEGSTSGRATIVMGTGDSAVTTTVDYTYNPNRTVTLTYVEGADEYEYSLKLSESYNLILAFINSRGIEKKMMLLQEGQIVDTLSGTYALKGNDGTAIMHKVATTGIYKLTCAKYNTYYVGYRIFDEAGNQLSFTSMTTAEVDIVLYAGQSLQVSAMMAPNASQNITYTLAYVGPVLQVSEITFDNTEATMEVGGETLTITATIAPEEAYNKTLTWTSSNEDVATVDANGVVTAHWEGTAVITATSENGITATCTITVTMVHVTGITLEQTAISIEHGKTEYVVPVVAPEDASLKSYTAQTGDIQIVECWVNDQGLGLKGYNDGTTTVTLTTVDGKYTATIEVTVWAHHVESVTLDKTEAEVYYGSKLTLTATVSPENASEKSGTWTSSAASVATVSSSGVVTAAGLGTATITFTTADGAKTATCEVTVKYKPLEEGSSDSFATTRYGHTRYEFQGEPNTKYIFKVSNLSSYMFQQIIDDAGNLKNYTAHKPAEMTSDANGIIRIDLYAMAAVSNAVITVGKSLPAESVAFESETFETYLDQTWSFDLVFTPSADSIYNTSGTWKSSDTSIVSVSSAGVVTPQALGTATITFTLSSNNTITATRTVIVKARELPEEGFAVTANKKYAFTFNGDANASYVVSVSGVTSYVFLTVSGTTIATNENGIFSADANGAVQFILQPKATGTVTITKEKGIELEGVAFESESAERYVGDVFTLSVITTPENASDKSGVWTSSNEDVAKVDANGKVTVEGEGTATITFTSNAGGFTATFEVSSTYRTFTEGRIGGEDIPSMEPTIYLLTVFDGETWTFSDFDNAYLEIECAALKYNKYTYEETLALSEPGEYIIYFYSYDEEVDAGPAYFTLTKTGQAIPVMELPVDEVTEDVTVGEIGLYITLAENGSYKIYTEDDSLMFASKTESGPSLTLLDYEKGTRIKVTIPANSEATEVTADIWVEVYDPDKGMEKLTEGDHAVKATANSGPTYKLVVAEGESWSITSSDGSAWIVIGIKHENGRVEASYDLEATKLTKGTYYVQIFADTFDEGEFDCNFTVVKGEEIIEIEVGENEIAVGTTKVLGNNSYLDTTIKLVGGKANATYTVTFHNEGASTIECGLGQNTATGMPIVATQYGLGACDITLTMEANASGDIYIYVMGDKLVNATLTVEEA